MMKKLFSIVLCFTLLLSCMPAMADDAVATSSPVPSLAGVENVYSVDLSGNTPVLKLNGQAITDVAPDDAENNPPTLVNRGNVTVEVDKVTTGTGVGERVARLQTNGADDIRILDGTELSLQNARVRYVSSAMMVDMGKGAQAAPLTGNVVIKFKVLNPFNLGGSSTVDGCSTSGWNRFEAPLVLNDIMMGVDNKDPFFLSTSRGGTYIVGENQGALPNGSIVGANSSTGINYMYGTAEEHATGLGWNSWHDYTLLYDTTTNKFKLWINGVQYTSKDGGEWFTDNWHDLEGSINDVIFSTWAKADYKTNTNWHGFFYFKDMAFGTVAEAPATWTPVNVHEISFDEADHVRTTTNAADLKLYNEALKTQVASGTTTGNATVTKDITTYWNVKYPTTGTLTDEAVINRPEVPPVANPNANYYGNKAWRMMSDCTAGSGYAYWGRDFEITRKVNGADVNITNLDKVTVIEFDFLNNTTTEGTSVSPFMFTDGTTSYHTTRFLTFDSEGIRVNYTHTGNSTTVLRSENTVGRWYNIKIVFDPTTKMFQTWIDGEPVINPANNAARFTIPTYLNATKWQLGMGLGLSDGKKRDVYFDNLKIYEYDNNVVVHGSEITIDATTNNVSFTGGITNNTDEAIDVVPVLALYAGNILKTVKIGDTVTATVGNKATGTVNVNASEFAGQNLSAKGFVWKGSFEDITPFDFLSCFGSSIDGSAFRGWNIVPAELTPAE